MTADYDPDISSKLVIQLNNILNKEWAEYSVRNRMEALGGYIAVFAHTMETYRGTTMADCFEHVKMSYDAAEKVLKDIGRLFND